MGQWVHQQSSTMYVNRGIKWWFIVCCPKKQTSKKLIWVGLIFVHSSHLLLCVDSKSSPGHTTVYSITPIFPFRPRDQLDDQSVLLSPPFLPVCTKSDVHTKFPHPHFISMTSIFGQREYKIRLHEVALPLTIEEEKKVTLDHPIERGWEVENDAHAVT